MIDDRRLRLGAMAALGLAVVPVLAHAFARPEQFIHRGDDAFYYFKTALNHVRYGFWTFDGINATNGVQPLWAYLLTGIAHVLSLLGLDDAWTAARAFVLVSALLHLASCALLFRLLERSVSLGTAIAATGGLLFSMSIVWARVWGVENALYATLLIATVHWYHWRFLPAPSTRGAVILGLLLGLTALSRLNAALLAPCVVLHYFWVERRERHRTLRLSALAAVAASALLLPYVAYNYASTGHLMPVSGAVKQVLTAQLLEHKGIESRMSLDFLRLVRNQKETLVWFVTSRGLDGLWAAGSRLLFTGATKLSVFAAIVLGLLLLPAAGGPRAWLARLRERGLRLASLGEVGVFALLNVAVSIVLYPTQIGYAMSRWWLVDAELVLTVTTAALLAAAAGAVGERFLRPGVRVGLTLAMVGALAVFHTQQSLRFYRQPERVHRDWNKSWNDEPYLAAQWLAKNVPHGARVGAWNAGVLGHYSLQSVTNLDGLINDFDFIPYLRDRRVGAYVLERRIEYLADIQPMMERVGVLEQLELETVYSHENTFMRSPYRIYRVLGRRTSATTTPHAELAPTENARKSSRE